ncbi:Uncharacterised protein [Legionella steigerwaltii]|uniref:F-box domain-containing protein n=1 Tax=Legionella steigerwaltii TaxID=460 RepID=A0A378L4G7_9GAMM|nr:F-box protein [Legionella steigerwaltii]KTD72027.1 hypothetical protein Lstg_2728 [Legionella steigerwaltii]STY21693.1 Uncharacterised protein [Legionella steigerwaltii]
MKEIVFLWGTTYNYFILLNVKMHSKSENTVTPVAKTHTPNKLQDIILAKIAEDPWLSLDIIHNEQLLISYFKEALKNSAPFISIVPKELKLLILELTPIKDWKSLMKVSKEWRQLVAEAVNPRLHVLAYNLEPILTHDMGPTMETLLSQVEFYSQRSGRRANQVEQLMQLGKDMLILTKPLAKFLHCQQTISKIQGAIEGQYSGFGFYFGTPRNSQLFQIISSYAPKSLKLTNQPWFKELMFYIGLSPEHAVSKLFADAYLEIKNLKCLTPKADFEAEARIMAISM